MSGRKRSNPWLTGPQARIAVDTWHLVALANTMVTEVRQRSPANSSAARGRTTDPAWSNRRLLLAGIDHLSGKQSAPLGRMLDAHDPSKQIGAASAVKERLRSLMAQSEPSKIRGARWPTSTRRDRRSPTRSHPADEHGPDVAPRSWSPRSNG